MYCNKSIQYTKNIGVRTSHTYIHNHGLRENDNKNCVLRLLVLLLLLFKLLLITLLVRKHQLPHKRDKRPNEFRIMRHRKHNGNA